MTEEENLRAALEAARAKFHGFSCAVALHLAGDGQLDFLGLLESLRKGNLSCAAALGDRPEMQEGSPR